MNRFRAAVAALALGFIAPLLAGPVTPPTSPVTPVDEALHFLVIGDWGRHGQEGQSETAGRLAAAARKLNPAFVISTGDNFYPVGVASVDDPSWKTSFEDIYSDHALHTEWYVVLGNHDYRGNPQAEIDYSKISRRWQLPARYYTKTVHIGDNSSAQAQFFFIDTSPMIEDYQQHPDKYAVADQDAAAQLRWLEDALAQSKARWKIVIGHHPVYTVGKRKKAAGGGIQKELEKALVPLFEKYRVQAYIAGHEHDLQVIRRPGGTVTYLVSGAGSETRPLGVPDAKDGRLFAVASAGFMAFALTPTALNVELVDAENRVPYAITLKP
ncbi:tartrate-resistant acid phosphatase type 5 family protein [Nevskia sp.]|uniref:purple acid phosphatase family protein n=1 Tax=Nevskia sp. TaxID=1929292 RepID=UPI0025F097C8|nr:tartrate-resistant acid phosphatase type 5 family protein [Nevskia sp.]